MTYLQLMRIKHDEHLRAAANSRRKCFKRVNGRTVRGVSRAAACILVEDARKHINRAYLLRCKLKPSNPALAFAMAA